MPKKLLKQHMRRAEQKEPKSGRSEKFYDMAGYFTHDNLHRSIRGNRDRDLCCVYFCSGKEAEDMIKTFDLRPEVIRKVVVGNIQELEHLMRRKIYDDDIDNLVGIAIIAAVMMMHPAPALAVYQKGDIMRKAQPIIDVLKDAAEPVAYGMYIWSFIEYILGKRGEAKDRMKGTTWGFIGIQILPWFFNIIKSVGDF